MEADDILTCKAVLIGRVEMHCEAFQTHFLALRRSTAEDA